ncbi:endonuclease MutS2 [Rapidithrix thailandica]|uniref:Endonuclease MutS2 n=1 Tax=Rapidithrix thailandica TaxID=413964 RepID=A0AAW9SCW0_9BACT
MLYPKNIETKVGFDKIRQFLKEKCSGELGRQFVDKVRFTNNYSLLEKLLNQTEEFVKVLQLDQNFPDNHYNDLTPFLQKAEIEGAFLTEEEFYELRLTLGTLQACIHFFTEIEEELPTLSEVILQIEVNPNLLYDIDKVIDENGKMKDTASPELNAIRHSLISEKSRLRRRLDSIFKSLKNQGFAAEELNPTIREGRMVIPVYAEHKRHVKGLVHDASSTGQTLYIEPEELLNLNNEIKDLQIRERREIVKILTKLTNTLRPHLESLSKANYYLGMLDFIRAKARFALETEAIRPPVIEEPFIDWRKAFHPVLQLSFRAQNRKVVAQDIYLSQENRILVISGPNAGGKSVTLKTVGLLQYMLQCGLLVPMQEGSKAGFFQGVFMDIGDEQSLEDDLSTYSSHLTNMKFFLRHANAQSLCLIDEFGGGTEPELGGAIAESILEELNAKKVYGVITTHYANLKFYAERMEGITNGAMRYDVENLKPLYELHIGKPGSSFALEIAQNIRLPRQVVARARKKVGKKKINVEQLLNDLEIEKSKLEEKNQQLLLKERAMTQELEKYKSIQEYLDANKKKILNEAKIEAQRLLQGANQQIESAIRSIKENKAEKEETKRIRKELEGFKQSVTPEKVEAPVEPDDEYKVVGGTIKLGDYVKIKDQNAYGEVLSISGKDALVMIGSLKSNIKLNRLVKVTRKEFRKASTTGKSGHSAGATMADKMVHFNPSIDIRGKRAEEVLSMIDDFIDSAIMLSVTHLKILHGKGNGILREVVRNHLRNFKEVKYFEDEHADRGGAGVTLITLK